DQCALRAALDELKTLWPFVIAARESSPAGIARRFAFDHEHAFASERICGDRDVRSIERRMHDAQDFDATLRGRLNDECRHFLLRHGSTCRQTAHERERPK